MKKCQFCEQVSFDCICAEVDKFFEDNRELMKRSEKDQQKQCIACFFAPCRCREGLANKPN